MRCDFDQRREACCLYAGPVLSTHDQGGAVAVQDEGAHGRGWVMGLLGFGFGFGIGLMGGLWG